MTHNGICILITQRMMDKETILGMKEEANGISRTDRPRRQ